MHPVFFLLEYLKKAKKNEKILVIEKGPRKDHSWFIKNRNTLLQKSQDQYIKDSNSIQKMWQFTSAFGGGSNCWWGCTPRFHPNDFRMKSRYGVGEDWPISYQDLEGYYCEVEEIMQISGSSLSILPRSKSFPQPPHNYNKVDEILSKNYPDLFTIQPTARARVATKNRPSCCASGVCGTCPVDAKFTILNELNYIYEDPRVEVVFDAEVKYISYLSNIISGVTYRKNKKDHEASCDFLALGANAFFNPHILNKSGIKNSVLGKNLGEQAGYVVSYDLDGMESFQGSTSITGNGYMLYDGEHRSNYSGALLEVYNIPEIRLEDNKWRNRLRVKLVFEDIPSEDNFIDSSGEKPIVKFKGYSSYLSKAIKIQSEKLDKLFSVLPIEKKVGAYFDQTESHILGTARMGNDPKKSVVDRNLIHHSYRNLAVLGSGSFPTMSPSNPTLTLSALSLKSARSLS